MQDNVLVVADHHSWLTNWDGYKIKFEEITLDTLVKYGIVVLAPGEVESQSFCQQILEWKRSGLLDTTQIFLSTYKGRHLWSPENDVLVERWAVHAQSEREVLDSERLYFIPLCVMPPRRVLMSGDDGYVFIGGRKWRRLDVGIEALSRSGLPGRVISDFAPEGIFPGVQISREKIPKKNYIDVMERARVVLVPLHGTPVSHGHVDVVTAISVGKPVVVTAGASCDDYVQHGINGLLVKDNSVEAWVEAIHEAYEKADDFAAAARELAPRYDSAKYGSLVREMLQYPNLRRVLPEFGTPDPSWDRSEWHQSLERTEHYQVVRSAAQLVRDQLYAEALAKIEPCLHGPSRIAALKIKVSALMRIDPAGAEPVIRKLIEESSEDAAEARTSLASSLWSQRRRMEALTEARIAVELNPKRAASRTRLISYLRSMREIEEAKTVLAVGIDLDPSNKALLRIAEEFKDLSAAQ